MVWKPAKIRGKTTFPRDRLHHNQGRERVAKITAVKAPADCKNIRARGRPFASAKTNTNPPLNTVAMLAFRANFRKRSLIKVFSASPMRYTAAKKAKRQQVKIPNITQKLFSHGWIKPS